MAAIRHLAGSIAGPRIAAAAFEHVVSVWDVPTRAHVATLNTVLDFGGDRLAMHPSGQWIAAAAYNRRGLAAYDADTGLPVWTRPDVKQLQRIGFSPDGQSLFAGSDTGPCLVLDAATGGTMDSLRGVRAVHASPFQPVWLLDGTRPELRAVGGGRGHAISREGAGTLDVAFSPAAVCISEARGAVRCLDLASGREAWRHTPSPGRHVVRLAYLPADGGFAAFEWAYGGGGGARVTVLDGRDGLPGPHRPAGPSHVAAFVLSGECLLVADGTLLRTRDGGLEATLLLGRDRDPDRAAP